MQQSIPNIPPPPPKQKLTPEQTAECARLVTLVVLGRISEAQARARMGAL